MQTKQSPCRRQGSLLQDALISFIASLAPEPTTLDELWLTVAEPTTLTVHEPKAEGPGAQAVFLDDFLSDLERFF